MADTDKNKGSEVFRELKKTSKSKDKVLQLIKTKNTHKCDMCDETFAKPTDLRIHVKRHRDVKDYSCEICHKTFVTANEVNQHLVSHSDERKFRCMLCSKDYKRFVVY